MFWLVINKTIFIFLLYKLNQKNNLRSTWFRLINSRLKSLIIAVGKADVKFFIHSEGCTQTFQYPKPPILEVSKISLKNLELWVPNLQDLYFLL